MSQQFKNVFARIKQGEKSAKLDKDIDSILIDVQSSKEGLNKFTAAMADSEMTAKMKQLWDDSGVERWDLASTGGVANITPIFGYLWLMVAAEETKNGEKKVVPKISTDGKGGGTIDILESGGLTFPSDPEAIFHKCMNDGGVICQQDENLTPIDKALMSRRRETNLMTNVYLTYASIISKKIAMRCTHAIIDVKLGRDTKILSAWMNQLKDVKVEKLLKAFDKDTLVISDKESLKAFANVLQQLNIKTEEIDGDWIKQSLENGNQQLSPLKEVRWLLTNANIPQCRVIGRQLMLIHLDQLINGDDDLLKQDNYKKLYCEVLPEICGCNDEQQWKLLINQWKKLKAQLPKFDDFPALKLFEKKDLELEKSYPVATDLQVISFGLYPYHLAGKPVKITAMDVQFLDELFSWLCGSESSDPEVGIWLHKLPGETVEIGEGKPQNGAGWNDQRYLGICNKSQQPVISIFYRPSRNPESEVMAKVRQFLGKVEVEEK